MPTVNFTRELMLKRQASALGQLEGLRDQLSEKIREDAPQREIDNLLDQMESVLNACWDAGCSPDEVLVKYSHKGQTS